MTSIPKNSPIDIRAHVCYDKYQRISAEKSYSNYKKLCETMGKGSISFEEYESLYNQYLGEDERDCSIPDIRGCILSDVINGKPAKKSIDDLCNAFNNHKIDTEDHGYWYKHFENGHIFTRVTFSDFPEDIVAEIVGKCDLKTYLDLRNVSSGLRAIVDQKAPPCIDMEVNWGYVYINVMVNDELDFKNHFLDLLNLLDHKIHAEKFTINVAREKQVVEILQCFKPGTLEKLEIKASYILEPREIVEMDQWKQAKHLKFDELIMPPIENFFHFTTFESDSLESISVRDFVKLCENATNCINFESCTMTSDSQINKKAVKRLLKLQPTASRRVHSIPNTNLFVYFEGYDGDLNILKIYKN